MRLPTLLIVAVLTLALLPVSLADAQGSGGAATTAATTAKAKSKAKAKTKANAKRKRCKKGYVRKTVRVKRKGKIVRVKRCRKKKIASKQPVAQPKAPSTPAPVPAPVPGAAKPLFDPPGTTLDDAAAQTYIERYLLNTRFTDCPAGWPSCASEERYSHFANTNFVHCQLTPIAGLGIDFLSAFFFETGIVRPDGSWSFNEIVLSGGRPSFYDWSVATDGTVTGVYKFPGLDPEPIGPLRYVAGARGCSS